MDDDPKVRQIRAAARTLFLRHGYAEVSTASLAKEAGVSKETLYTRYPSKEAILADVLEHLITTPEDPGPADRPAPATPSELEDELRHFARHLLAELVERDYIELARIVVAETPRLPHIGETFRRAVPERALHRARDLLAAARRAELVGDVDLDAAARLFVAPLVIHALLNVMLVAPAEGRPADAFDIDAHVALVLRALSAKERTS